MEQLTKEELIVIDKALNILWEYGGNNNLALDPLHNLIGLLWSIWAGEEIGKE
jgi:hypothetical protein